MSASDIDATMTTAASVGCGRYCMRPGRNTSITRITAAPTRPVSWVFAPARSATAVREPLVLTGKPVNRPAATLAAPMPTISWFARTSWPVRPANADEVEIVSASETTAMPIAPATSSGRSASSTRGIVNGGRPLGSTPTRLDARGRRGPGPPPAPSRRPPRPARPAPSAGTRPEDHHHGDAEQPDADRRGHGVSRGDALHERLRLGDEPVRVGREAEQLRQLADEDRQGEAVHVADLGRLGQQVGDEAEAGARADEHERADHQREHRRVGDGRGRVAVGRRERQDRRRDHRAERGVRPEDEDPRRPEDRVGDQAQDRTCTGR